jgi:drug/metabolite transporter (DMT)-like permease
MAAANQHRLGILLVLGSAIAYSTAGFFTRLIPLDVWTLLFWRGLFGGVFMILLMIWRERRADARQINWITRPSWLIAGISAIGMVFYINALRAAPVADVALIYAAVPFVTAFLAWMVIGERSQWRTILASLVALFGVAVMVGGGVKGGYWWGDLLALGMTVAMASLTVAIRRDRHVDTLATSAAACFLGCLVALPWATLLRITPGEFALLAVFGVSQMGLGMLLLTAGTKRVSASESALLGTLDVPLAPLWVWLAFNETVGSFTWIGGGLVLLAVIADVVIANQRDSSKAAATA